MRTTEVELFLHFYYETLDNPESVTFSEFHGFPVPADRNRK